MPTNCTFCAHECSIQENAYGICGIRKNRNNSIVTVNYGKPCALAIDPIEKKPLYHFFPGSKTLSVALYGCNFKCPFCQNYAISQKEYFAEDLIATSTDSLSPSDFLKPEDFAQQVLASDLKIASYTYSEPTVWQDYMIDCARKVKENDGFNVMVSNGYFSSKNTPQIIEYINAFNIDLKGSDAFYKKECAASILPVIKAIESIQKSKNKVLEITTLLIEELHSTEDIKELAKILRDQNVQVWHLSRFFPAYKMKNSKPCSEEFLEKACDIAMRAGIPFVYTGNSENEKHNDTICPKCNKTLIARNSEYFGTQADAMHINNKGECAFCNEKIYGLFNV